MASDVEVGAAWLGMRLEADGSAWTLPVAPGVISGANALFGGCATAAALVAAGALVDQPVFWAAVHFGKLAATGTSVRIEGTVLSSGRTLSHLAVTGAAGGAEAFSARLTAGARPAGVAAGSWIRPPQVVDPDQAAPFDLPVHSGTWAERFEWRLAQPIGAEAGPSAAWWVRPQLGEPTPPLVVLAVLADYVTYGMGRAIGVPLGGLSIDNILRIHRPELSEWLLVEVRPGAVGDGLGFGSAYVYDSDRRLLAAGSQSIVANDWDWRLPHERETPFPVAGP
jgi:acyl-CoA thioesterase